MINEYINYVKDLKVLEESFLDSLDSKDVLTEGKFSDFANVLKSGWEAGKETIKNKIEDMKQGDPKVIAKANNLLKQNEKNGKLIKAFSKVFIHKKSLKPLLNILTTHADTKAKLLGGQLLCLLYLTQGKRNPASGSSWEDSLDALLNHQDESIQDGAMQALARIELAVGKAEQEAEATTEPSQEQ
jgi:hypothetical protein